MLVLLLAASVVSSAQLRKQVLHRVRVTGAAGYSMNISKDYVSSYGVKPMVGAGYRLQYGYLIFDAGVEGSYRFTQSGLVDIYKEGMMTDKQGDEYFGKTYWQERKLRQQRAEVGVPIAIGFITQYVYGSIGVKPAVTLWGTREERWLYTHEGEYSEYMEPFRNQPENGFPTREEQSGGVTSSSMSIDVLGTAEVGVCVDRLVNRGYEQKTRLHHYLGLFAEVGVPISGAVMPLTVGAKYTLEIGLKSKHKCTTCYGD